MSSGESAYGYELLSCGGLSLVAYCLVVSGASVVLGRGWRFSLRLRRALPHLNQK